MFCLSVSESLLPISPFRRPPRAAVQAQHGGGEDWAWLPQGILDIVAANLTAQCTDAADEVVSLYGMAGTCTRWRAVALPMLVGKAWKGKPGKLVHPSQLFIRTPKSKARSRQQAPLVKCALARRPALSALDSPTYELWQLDDEHDPAPRFLMSARMTSSCHFAISLARYGGGSSSSGSGGRCDPDMDCAELVTNMKRTEYELWACRKPWVTRALGDLAAVCGASFVPLGDEAGGILGGAAWLRKLLHLGSPGAAVRDDAGAGAQGGTRDRAPSPLGPSRYSSTPRTLSGRGTSGQQQQQHRQQQQHPLVQIHYFMRMHGLLLPRRLVVEVAQSPAVPAVMASNPLYDPVPGENEGTCERTGSDVAAERDQVPAYGVTGEARASSSGGGVGGGINRRGSPLGPARTQAQGQGSKGPVHDGLPQGDGAGGGPTWLRLQNVLPHWSPQLKCWCLKFNNRVKLPSIKNFQLNVCAEGRLSQQQQEQPIHTGTQATAHMPMVMQFGKLESNIFVLDYDPTAMNALQAFALGLSSFERKYALY